MKLNTRRLRNLTRLLAYCIARRDSAAVAKLQERIRNLPARPS